MEIYTEELIGHLRSGPLSRNQLRTLIAEKSLSWRRASEVLTAQDNKQIFRVEPTTVSLVPEFLQCMEEAEGAEREEEEINGLWASFQIKKPKLQFPVQKILASHVKKMQDSPEQREKICVEIPQPEQEHRESTWSHLTHIAGLYTLSGSHHGQPVFSKDHYILSEGKKVFPQIYFWDDDCESMCGWWIAPEIGSESYFAFNNTPRDATSPADLATEWTSGEEQDDDPLLVKKVDSNFTVSIKDNRIVVEGESKNATRWGKYAVRSMFEVALGKYAKFADETGEKVSDSELVCPQGNNGVYRVLLEHPTFDGNVIPKSAQASIKAQAPGHDLLEVHPRGAVLYCTAVSEAIAALHNLHFFQLNGQFIRTTWLNTRTTPEVDNVYATLRKHTRRCHTFMKGAACSAAECVYAHGDVKVDLNPQHRISVANLPVSWDLEQATVFFKQYTGFEHFGFSQDDERRGIVTFQTLEFALDMLSRIAGHSVDDHLLHCEWAMDAFVPKKVLAFYSPPSRLWKTRMCGGNCRQESCPFAHSAEDKRTIEAIPGEQSESLPLKCDGAHASEIVYIDSLPMPKRPNQAPSVRHKALFFKVEPMVADEEWRDTAQAALSPAKIWFAHRSGYAVFASHAAAETCLADTCVAGIKLTWSESERLSTHSYKRDLLTDIEKQLASVAEKSGATVKLCTTQFIAFEVTASSMDYVDLAKAFLASSLNAAHESVTNTTSLLISGLEDYTEKQFEHLVLPFKPYIAELFEHTGLILVSATEAILAKDKLHGVAALAKRPVTIEVTSRKTLYFPGYTKLQKAQQKEISADEFLRLQEEALVSMLEHHRTLTASDESEKVKNAFGLRIHRVLVRIEAFARRKVQIERMKSRLARTRLRKVPGDAEEPNRKRKKMVIP